MSILGAGVAKLQQILFQIKNSMHCGKHKRIMLTSPSGCRRWGHRGSDSIHQRLSPEQEAGPAGQQMTPFFTLRGEKGRKIDGCALKVTLISSHSGLFVQKLQFSKRPTEASSKSRSIPVELYIWMLNFTTKKIHIHSLTQNIVLVSIAFFFQLC